MIQQAEISKLAYRESVSDRTIEKDYVIGWILLGLADSKLKKILAFKGGTALKKIYFVKHCPDTFMGLAPCALN
jgi:predicted nucleotidyltransferase component of viral defense system